MASKVFFNPYALFTWVAAIAQREYDMEKYFKLEMSPYPPSLFKDALTRKPGKPTLRKVFLTDEDRVNEETVVPAAMI